MQLSTNPQFIEHYLSGRKKHSFRNGNRWRADMSIQYYRDRYQPTMCKFMPDGKCTAVQEAKLIHKINNGKREISLFLDGRLLDSVELKQVAYADGFDNEIDFVSFFFPDNTEGVWDGQLVHWTDLKY